MKVQILFVLLAVVFSSPAFAKKAAKEPKETNCMSTKNISSIFGGQRQWVLVKKGTKERDTENPTKMSINFDNPKASQIFFGGSQAAAQIGEITFKNNDCKRMQVPIVAQNPKTGSPIKATLSFSLNSDGRLTVAANAGVVQRFQFFPPNQVVGDISNNKNNGLSEDFFQVPESVIAL